MFAFTLRSSVGRPVWKSHDLRTHPYAPLKLLNQSLGVQQFLGFCERPRGGHAGRPQFWSTSAWVPHCFRVMSRVNKSARPAMLKKIHAWLAGGADLRT